MGLGHSGKAGLEGVWGKVPTLEQHVVGDWNGVFQSETNLTNVRLNLSGS